MHRGVLIGVLEFVAVLVAVSWCLSADASVKAHNWSTGFSILMVEIEAKATREPIGLSVIEPALIKIDKAHALSKDNPEMRPVAIAAWKELSAFTQGRKLTLAAERRVNQTYQQLGIGK